MDHIVIRCGAKAGRFAIGAVCAALLTLCQGAEPEKAVVKNPGKQAPPAVSTEAGPVADTTHANSSNRKLVVYYFHTTYRCQSCNMIEAYTKEAVNTGFSDLLKNGRMEIRVVNVETPGNEHFMQDYRLYTKSVVVSDLLDGKEAQWKNLDQVWVLLRDRNKFIEYVQKEIRPFLEG